MKVRTIPKIQLADRQPWANDNPFIEIKYNGVTATNDAGLELMHFSY
jgi:hypothetical protein